MKTIKFILQSFPSIRFLILIQVVFSTQSFATTVDSQPRGAIVKYLGDIALTNESEAQVKQFNKKNRWLFDDNRLDCGLNSKAFVKMTDGSRLLLRDQSSVLVQDSRQIRVLKGKVLFAIAKRKPSQKPFQVATRVAKLGIRGTQFVVEAGEQNDQFNIYLKEGEVSLTPEAEQFKLYRDHQQKEFEAFVDSEQNAFEDYKSKQQEAFVEFVREYEMRPNSGIAINGDELREVAIPPEVDALFTELDDPAFQEKIAVE